MKLLICTQKVDKNDSVLGFFHRWIEEFSKHCETVTVICLEKGQYSLPNNVKVLSLGKEHGVSRMKYIFRFYKYILKYRNEYDFVFVHMNPEYVVLGGIFWKLWNKKVSLWYNHKFGNYKAKLSKYFVDRIFYTSKYSFFSNIKKSRIMPVGIDINLFSKKNINLKENTILYCGRISKIKRIGLLVEILNILVNREKQNLYLDFVGDFLENDMFYKNTLLTSIKTYNLNNNIRFLGIADYFKLPKIYSQYPLVINLTNSGSLDKVIFEALSCESPVMAINNSVKHILPEVLFLENDNINYIVNKIKKYFEIGLNYEELESASFKVKKEHSLKNCINKVMDFYYEK